MRSAKVYLKWSGSPAEKAARRAAARKLNKAAHFLRGQVVEAISTSTRANGPSEAGEPPHADTGKLRQSIQVRQATPDSLEAEVGSTLDYAGYLEYGTRIMAARPYLSRMLTDHARQICGILKHG